MNKKLYNFFELGSLILLVLTPELNLHQAEEYTPNEYILNEFTIEINSEHIPERLYFTVNEPKNIYTSASDISGNGSNPPKLS